MPEADVEVTEELVVALLRAQLPARLRPELDEGVRFVAQGWDNVTFRIGTRYAARLPVRSSAVPLLAHETRWLPRVAPLLSVATPLPEHVGAPALGYPYPWTVVRWCDGERVADLPHAERGSLVTEVAAQLAALHTPAPLGAPRNPVRGVPLTARDAVFRERAEQVRVSWGSSVAEGALAVWEAGLAAPLWPYEPVWVHGDPHALNLLQLGGRLTGVIDFGDLTAGDPASDHGFAWMTFTRRDRHAYREAVMAAGRYDAAIWLRARAWAMALSLAILVDPNPGEALTTMAKRALVSVLRP